MSRIALRLLGGFLLTLAIVIPSCRALYTVGGEEAPAPFEPRFTQQ